MAKDPSKTPKPLPLPKGKTVQSYPLSTVDGFVLSRVDGTLSVTEIVSLTSLDEATVRASLEKLVALGLIELGNAPAGPRSKPPPAFGTPIPNSLPPRPITEVSNVLDTGAPKPKPALYDPAEIDEDVDLDREHRSKILDMYYQLGELDLYAVLGIERSVDKKAVKRAYYELASIHHPDRFFRKRLGTFKQKMEAVFSRITEAHDTLADKTKRAEYDTYLDAQIQARALESQLTRRLSSPGMERVDRAKASPSLQPPSAPPQAREERTSGIQLSEQARRDALARRLLGGRGTLPPARNPTPVPTSSDPDSLRRHYEFKINAVREHMAKDHLASAEQAVADGDWVAATTAYRLALQINPDDDRLKTALFEAQGKANTVLADAYRKQAEYEEKSGKLAEAARSWQRVTKALPDNVEAYAQAASCMLRAGVDLRQAATLAQRAMQLDPQQIKHRLTLAEIYIGAGLQLNARRELEAAARLAPDDANIEALLKRAGKG